MNKVLFNGYRLNFECASVFIFMAAEEEPKYQIISKLGEGTYGIVYKGIEIATQKFVAMKRMKIDQEEDGIRPTTLREMSIMKSVSHPNVLALKDVKVTENSVTLIMDFLNFDLRQVFNKLRSKLDPKLAKSYAFQMLCGIFTLHTHRIIHRDLKPENILLDHEGNLKIGDFGLSRYFTLPMRQYSPNVVSLWYRAPELLFGKKYYELSIDIWSIGCIIAEMYRGKPLFNGDSEIDQLHKTFAVLGSPTPEDISDFDGLLATVGSVGEYQKQRWEDLLDTDDLELVDLMSRIMQYNPVKRITAQEALRHPYFACISEKIREVCWPPGL